MNKGQVIMQEVDVTDAVNCYREMLRNNFCKISKFSINNFSDSNWEQTDYLEAWMQANWEMIVECSIAPELKIVLEIYGFGADYNGASSRIWRPLASATHYIKCVHVSDKYLTDVLLEKTVKGIPKLGQFCTIKKGWVSYENPFDHVEIQGDSTRVVSAENLKYFAVPFICD